MFVKKKKKVKESKVLIKMPLSYQHNNYIFTGKNSSLKLKFKTKFKEVIFIHTCLVFSWF